MQQPRRIINLIESKREDLWLGRSDYELFFADVGAPHPPAEHLEFIKRNHGEIMACTNDASEILGWLGLIPEGDSAELAGIGTNRKFRNTGVATELLNGAEAYLLGKGVSNLRFQTSPLLTANALLYLRQSNTDFTYHDGILVGKDNDIPWAVVDCSMRLPRVRNRARDEIPEDLRSVLSWSGLTATVEPEVLQQSSEYKAIALPELNIQDILAEMKKENVDFLFRTAEVFRELTRLEYRIIGYDLLDGQYAYFLRKNDLTEA